MKFTIDIRKLEADVARLKSQILQGAINGFENGSDYLTQIMTFYVEEEVYKAYSSASQSPDKYERTYNLEKSIKAQITGNAIYVYSDSSIAPYNERVIKGNDIIPYDFPWVPQGSEGDFRPARDFVEATREEFINHMNQSRVFMNIVIEAIKKNISGR